MNKTIFLTGATGLVGANLAARILKSDSQTRLVLLVRGSSDNEARARFLKTLWFVNPDLRRDSHGIDGRIQVVRGDVTLESMGFSENTVECLSSEITHIIHAAANVRFNQPLCQAREINVQGTQNLMDFAGRVKDRGNLQRVAYISTAYVSGDRDGVVYEHELDCGQQFGNSYEQTKFEAECYVRGLMPQLPITIFRPSIIVGDSRTGRTTAFNVLYAPLRVIYQGLIKILPGSCSTPIDVVPVDFVSEAIYSIFLKTNQGVGETFHLTAGSGYESTTGEVVDTAVEYFNEAYPEAQLRRVTFLPLNLYRRLFEFTQERMKRVLHAMEQYIPYLCVSRTFDCSSTQVALQGTYVSIPHFRRYSRTLLQYCLDVDWGRRLTFAE